MKGNRVDGWARQAASRVRFEWGLAGADAIAADADIAVVVDVLSFTTTLSVALDAVHKLLMARNKMGPHAVGLEVDRAERELLASTQRLHDLRAHARTEAEMLGIEQQAAAAGFCLIERLPQYHAGSNLVGWRLKLRRP